MNLLGYHFQKFKFFLFFESGMLHANIIIVYNTSKDDFQKFNFFHFLKAR